MIGTPLYIHLSVTVVGPASWSAGGAMANADDGGGLNEFLANWQSIC